MSNREVILTTALQLFNDRGCADVSTNHIAAAAGLSPGNLYYHFRNKDEIILALVEALFARWEAELVLDPHQVPKPADLEGLVSLAFRLVGDYRFFYRDLARLIRTPGSLQDFYRAQRRRGLADFATMVRALADAGALPTRADEAWAEVAEGCWLVVEFWWSHLEVSGRGWDDASQGLGRAQIFRLLGYSP